MIALPLLPTIITDIAGSVADVVFAFLALRYAYLLTRKQPENFLWGFLFYFCLVLAIFSISRAAGHLLKQFLFMGGYADTWHCVSPYSGGFNTLLMISVSAVTLFYHKGVEAYHTIEQKAAKLKNVNLRLAESAHKLKDLNLTLEEKVKERTAELSQSEEKFHHLFSASKDMVFFCDNGGHLKDINESGLEMLNYDTNERPLLSLDDIFVNESELDIYLESMHRDGYIKDFEAEFKRKDGSIINVLLSASAILGDNGNMIGCEGIAKDLTRVKTMMEQLVSSEKMVSVGQMAAGVAHEINTPLGIILGYAQLMMDDFDKDSEVYQNLAVIERQTKASRKIVADLLKFSRQSGSVREDIDLNEVLRDVTAVTEHNLSMDHIYPHLNLAPQLPTIVGDAEKLRQVFVNLINNAHHAMEEQGKGDLYISSWFDPEKKEVVAEVRDTGHGIPDNVRARIFDPFFTTKAVGKGTGLGLSVSYGIVKDHGGVIEVESPVEDKKTGTMQPGTAFVIRLPVLNEPDALNAQHPATK